MMPFQNNLKCQPCNAGLRAIFKGFKILNDHQIFVRVNEKKTAKKWVSC